MKWNFVNVCIVILTIHLLSGCMPNYIQENISSEDTIISSNVLDDRKKVDFEEVKEDLVGSYSYGSDFTRPYSSNYIFLENGDYIVINFQNNVRFTNENSTAEYYVAEGKEMLVLITKDDGASLELYGNGTYLCLSDRVIFARKVDPAEKYAHRIEHLNYYKPDNFNDIVIGESTYEDVIKVTYFNDIITITDIGDISEYPMEDGRFIRITYDEELIVQSIEVVDSMCEVYF